MLSAKFCFNAIIYLYYILCITIFVNCIIFSLTHLRTFFVAAREGLLPEFLSMIHINHLTPIPAIAISVIITFLNAGASVVDHLKRGCQINCADIFANKIKTSSTKQKQKQKSSFCCCFCRCCLLLFPFFH